MSITIPWTRIASISAPRPVLFSGDQEGSLGGPSLPIPRMGDRFAVDVATAQLRQDAEARQLNALLTMATTADARIALRLPMGTRPIGGAPVVDGANQTGSTLSLRGLYAGCAIVFGRFFHITHGGRNYVHMAAAQAIADPSGRVSLPIWPMLRFLTADGDSCVFDVPVIEGKLVGFEGKGARFSRNRIDPIEFSIVERT